MKVAVVGTGYVGLVTGVVLADLGNDVICVDNDPAKISKLRAGISPIYEPGVEEMLRHNLAAGNLTISDSIADAVKVSEVVFIAVGTPPGEDGTPDLTAVKAVATGIAKAIDKYTVVVNKSTVPVGSGDLVENLILSQGVSRDHFDVVSNPEFLREGQAVNDTLYPERIVIGSERREAATKLVELYAFLERPMIITDRRSAEMIKYAANSFLAMKISYINAIARLCELAGANVGVVAKGIGTDGRIGPQFLQAGLGWGGSCFPKDVQGLIKIAEQFDYDFKLLKEVVDINADQTKHFVRRLDTHLAGLSGKTIALLGLAFKPDTDDIRDAKSLVIIEEIKARGGKIQAYDPIAEANVRELHPDLTYCQDPYATTANADAVVLVTEWKEFRWLDLVKLAEPMKRKVMFDGRRFYQNEAAERAGFEYFTIGS